MHNAKARTFCNVCYIFCLADERKIHVCEKSQARLFKVELHMPSVEDERGMPVIETGFVL